ncbi:alpha-glucuronidase [Promicromonospora thailandica]|uniref:Alpha-glucuronidase n=1 Tax=Promicromonospora thailandica TaxID=765201 RepID=A0A9X2FYL0_9MICO|nr:alpha-glucuronidase [Promicromonospora thailandica]MCP2263564.1 alpha-glucuronidase [Promicromonospora thailandica]
MTADAPGFVPTPHPAWLPDDAFAALGRRRVVVAGDGALAGTVAEEVAAATARFGGSFSRLEVGDGVADADLVLTLATDTDAGSASGTDPDAGEGFRLTREGGAVVVQADGDAGLLHGLFHVVRLGEAAFDGPDADETHAPATGLRMLDHWDNVDTHPVMGQVERGYSGGSLFYEDGVVRADLSRVERYARLLAAVGINRVAINNVNVHRREARLLTDDLGDVVRIAAVFRRWGIRVHLSVSFASPILLGGLSTSDPLDTDVAHWWVRAAARVWSAIPDFGGFVVKADSEGQPGPFAYGRTHADGANMLAAAVEPYDGLIHWRAFVYDHRQDWRDRSTDRARAAYDHFHPLDGAFADNVVVQVKYGPMDFQVREPVSPVLAAMPRTRIALELQVTQEYTGQQRHAVYLGPQWSQILGFSFWSADGGASPTVADLATGRAKAVEDPGTGAWHKPAGGFAAVSNAGDDEFWTGHPFAQANLYAYGRLCWDPTLDPADLLDEWAGLTFPGAPDAVRQALHTVLDGSWETYERYTSPLGVGFMVRPGHHYGPDVDGYEYTPWGTYHFADRDGIGVDRSVRTGTGYAGQYPSPWRETYESTRTCPDELLLFFHHVPYTHVLHSGSTVIQHIYDTHFAGVDAVERMIEAWSAVSPLVDPRLAERVAERFAEQLRSATEWRDQINTYFLRKSGIPDERGRTIY